MPADPTPRESPQPPCQEIIAPSQERTIESESLFQGDREILIKHRGELYRLRITRNEKLILHK